MAKGLFGMLTGTSLKETGNETKPMATESILMQMEPNIKDIGKMISRTATEWRSGTTAPGMKATMSKDVSTVRELIFGLMGRSTKENG